VCACVCVCVCNELQPVLADKTVDTQRLLTQVRCARVCVRVCLRVCVCVCMCEFMCVCRIHLTSQLTPASTPKHQQYSNLWCAPQPQVDAERAEAEAIRKVVVEEEMEVKIKQAETQQLKDEAQKELEQVRRLGRVVVKGGCRIKCQPR